MRLFITTCIALSIQYTADANPTGPMPAKVTDIETQREHVTGGLRGNSSDWTISRHPRNYFPFIQTAEGQELLDQTLARIGGDNWLYGGKCSCPEALAAFLAMRGDEKWFLRFADYTRKSDNSMRREIVTGVGFARTERAKQFLFEQLDIAYKEAIEEAHGQWKNWGQLHYLGDVGRSLVAFDQSDTSARVDEMITKLRNALSGPEYEKRVLACELAVHNCFLPEDIARYMEVRNLPRAEATAAIGGQANVTGDESHNPIPANTSDNDTAITWFAGIAAGLIACALFVCFWVKKRRGAG